MHPTRRTPDLSFVSGTSDRPLMYQTVDGVLKAAALGWPDRLALAAPFQSRRYSFAEFDAQVEQVARGMMGCGLKPGERIGIWSPNCAEWVLTMFAAARAGLVLVNINPAYRQTELEFALRLVGCRALVFAPRFKTSDYGAMLRSLMPELSGGVPGRLECAAFPELRLFVQLGTEPMARRSVVRSAHRRRSACRRGGDGVDREDAGCGPGVQHPVHQRHHRQAQGRDADASQHRQQRPLRRDGMRLSPDDRLCIPVPLYHCFGMVLAVLAAVSHGAAMVFPGEAFDPVAALAAVAEERCTALHGVPTMFIAELAHPRFGEFDLSSLRTGIMAGSPCPIETMRQVVSQMHMREVTICYGMTETSPCRSRADPTTRSTAASAPSAACSRT